MTNVAAAFRMRPVAILCLLVLLTPMGLARPLSHDGSDHLGVATQSSRDEAADWYDHSLSCGAMLTPFRYTLVVQDGAPSDVLLLEARQGRVTLVAVATMGQPAVIEATAGSTCPAFAVTGALVAGEAHYVVTAQRL